MSPYYITFSCGYLGMGFLQFQCCTKKLIVFSRAVIFLAVFRFLLPCLVFFLMVVSQSLYISAISSIFLIEVICSIALSDFYWNDYVHALSVGLFVFPCMWVHVLSELVKLNHFSWFLWQPSYTILTEADIQQHQEDDITRVSTVLSISRDDAIILLRHYNWYMCPW